MYETGQHIKDTVEELEAYVKTNVVANATTFGVQVSIKHITYRKNFCY